MTKMTRFGKPRHAIIGNNQSPPMARAALIEFNNHIRQRISRPEHYLKNTAGKPAG